MAIRIWNRSTGCGVTATEAMRATRRSCLSASMTKSFARLRVVGVFGEPMTSWRREP